jgi:4-amino-4-deoxy-L-arabinose transferase-like glycosyltransferase
LDDSRGAPRRGRGALVPLTVFLLAAIVLLPNLGGENVWSKDEARDGLVARDMQETGRWLIPHLGGLVYPYKPPLFHWLVALASPHGVTEWSLRLPSVLAAAATVALTYSMGARLGTPMTGLLAAAMLVSSATFVEWARIGRLEMLLVLWLTLGFWSALRWLDGGRRRDALLLGLALGLGVLTKGPVALAPLGILIVALALLRRWPRGAFTDLGLALAVAAALPVAWLGLAAAAHAGANEYLKAVIANFAVEVRVLRNQHPLFAAEAIGVGFLPWTLLLPGVVVILARRWRTSWRPLLLPLLWAGFILVTFTVFISPRAVYFLPTFPPLALLTAWAWSACAVQDRRWLLSPLVATVIAFFLMGVWLALWPMTIEWQRQITVLGRALGIAVAVMSGAAALVVAALVTRRRTDAVPLVVGAAALVVLVTIQVMVRTPRANLAYPTREVAARFAALLPHDAEVAYMDLKVSTALMFYTKRRQVELPYLPAMTDLTGNPRRYSVLPNEVIARLWEECAPPPLREETIFGSRYGLYNGVTPLCP